MDEGLPVAYPLLERGVPVIASDGEQVGTVDHVVAAPEEDIFHGLVIAIGGRDQRFVAAEMVQSMHERGVDLSIDSSQVIALPHPDGPAPVFREDPGDVQGWSHWMHKLSGRGDWKRD
jgi:hypothetical protein